MWGANRTGRPFTGDHAGVLFYETLLKFGLAEGVYDAAARRRAAAQRLRHPQFGQMPAAAEQAAARPRSPPAGAYYEAALALLPNVRVLVALGRIAHGSAVRAAGGRLRPITFGHLAEHRLPDGRILIDSYHCSRYNQNTGRLTRAMFEAVFARALEQRR